MDTADQTARGGGSWNVVVLARLYSRPCSLISCVLVAQIWRQQPPCHSLHIYNLLLYVLHTPEVVSWKTPSWKSCEDVLLGLRFQGREDQVFFHCYVNPLMNHWKIHPSWFSPSLGTSLKSITFLTKNSIYILQTYRSRYFSRHFFKNVPISTNLQKNKC